MRRVHACILPLAIVLFLSVNVISSAPRDPSNDGAQQLDLVVNANDETSGPVNVVMTEDKIDYDSSLPVFEPEDDWKEILPGQAVPGGLHYRMNLETGRREARLTPGGYNPKLDTIVEPKKRPTTKKLTAEQQEIQRAELIERVMRSLPEPPPELKSVNRSVSPEKWKDVLNILWKKRQKLILEASSQIHDSATAMQNATRDLMDTNTTAEEKVGILKAVQALVRQIDNANDFKTVGGLAVTTSLLDDESSKVRQNAAWVISTACRNVATVQAAALDLGVVDKLLHNLENENDVGTAKKLILALSAVVRGLEPAIKRLRNINGKTVLNNIALKTVNKWYLDEKVLIGSELCGLKSKIITTVTDLPEFCGDGIVALLLDPECDTNVKREEKMFAFQNLIPKCHVLRARHKEVNNLLNTWLEEWQSAKEDSYEYDLADLARAILS